MLTNFYICVHYYTSKCGLKWSSNRGGKKKPAYSTSTYTFASNIEWILAVRGFLFFLLFFPHYLWTACSRREPAYNCYLSRTVASCKRLKCHSLQLKLSRSVFSKEVCALFGFFFLLWKIILFWLFTKILDGFYCYLGLFLMGILEILQNERKPKFLIHKSF